jgi:HTH-type transcriptional regulator/antitoxin HipB
MTQIRSMHDLTAASRGCRLDLGLTQAELADRARVSREWVNYFEKGKRTVELALVLRVLDTLGLRLELSRPTTTTADPPGSETSGLDTYLDEYTSR